MLTLGQIKQRHHRAGLAFFRVFAENFLDPLFVLGGEGKALRLVPTLCKCLDRMLLTSLASPFITKSNFVVATFEREVRENPLASQTASRFADATDEFEMVPRHVVHTGVTRHL